MRSYKAVIVQTEGVTIPFPDAFSTTPDPATLQQQAQEDLEQSIRMGWNIMYVETDRHTEYIAFKVYHLTKAEYPPSET